VTVQSVRGAAGTAVRFTKPRGIRELVFALPELDSLAGGASARAAGEGAVIGDFDADTYRSDRKDLSVQSFVLAAAGPDKGAVQAGFAEGVIVGESQNFTRSLVNEPGNKLTPTISCVACRGDGCQVGLDWEVHSTEKAARTERWARSGACRRVLKSRRPLIVLKYAPEGVTDGPVLGLVGKGITFDTGGISIKPADKMELMKYDMAGGAAMLGAMRAIALLKPKVRVICIVCAAENMPDGKAYKPGDVVTAMSGKDHRRDQHRCRRAAGAGDGLTYAKSLGATHLIDAATLTGAIGVALGTWNAGAFSNDDDTFAKFQAGLAVSGEKFLADAFG